MKRAFFIAICLLTSCLGCAGKQAAPLLAQTSLGCGECFPADAWRAVHHIKANFGPAGSISLIGVSQGDPVSRKLTSVLMTAEGFVLLDVQQSPGEQEVLRALPPFDNPEMVQGMLSDVALMFLPPKGRPSISKTSCLWRLEGGSQFKVARLDDGGCLLELKDKSGELTRKVRMDSPRGDGFASNVELTAMGQLQYALGLHLLRSERISDTAAFSAHGAVSGQGPGN